MRHSFRERKLPRIMTFWHSYIFRYFLATCRNCCMFVSVFCGQRFHSIFFLGASFTKNFSLSFQTNETRQVVPYLCSLICSLLYFGGLQKLLLHSIDYGSAAFCKFIWYNKSCHMKTYYLSVAFSIEFNFIFMHSVKLVSGCNNLM